MAEPQIRFDDGAGYERMMGKWSRLAGEVFLDWLKPASSWPVCRSNCWNRVKSLLLPAVRNIAREGGLRRRRGLRRLASRRVTASPPDDRCSRRTATPEPSAN